MLRRCTARFSARECHLAVDNRVATIILDRLPQRNALGRQLVAEFRENLDKCLAMPPGDLRAVVIGSASPKFFCAGADLKERKTMTPDEARAFVDLLRDTFNKIEDLPVPTIAAVEGPALGGGLELALSADLRVGGAGAKFGVPETSLAIIPGAGGTYRLPKLIGLARAKHMAFTGAPVNTTTALDFGLINEAAADGEAVKAAQAMAAKIATNGPIAVRAVKEAMARGYGGDRTQGLQCERDGYDRVLPTKDRIEGLTAFAEKRKAEYKGE